ncbi:unnamed protein product [Arabidopsis lyrata]|nr:unnamed protein product [Arabidopsis lyrata]
MAGVLESFFWIIICIHVVSLVLAQDRDQFLHYNFSQADLHLDGMANIDDGRLHLTNNTTKSTGHAFNKTPMQFTASSSFSTEFVFAMLPLQGDGQGMAFVVSPTKDLRYAGAATSDLGIFNKTNDNKTENHILAIELDTNDSSESFDKSGNHVGIDINSIVSVEYANASYFNDTQGKNITLSLASGKSILIWIDYDGIKKLLNVTLAPVPTPKPVSPLFSRSIKPRVPLLSRSINLSEIFNETMYVGFSGSTGTVKSDQYILGWSFKKGGQAESLDISKILDPPNRPPPPLPPTSRSKDSKNIIIISVTVTSIAFLLILGGILYFYKNKKYAEVLEQWENEYSPQRFSFKNLYKATRGFRENRLLGAGGFGKVYKGELPSGTQIAVKRVYHDAEQGMTQYVAEIASMGRLRHKNLVQLLGYCRRKGELLLVYDYMPNGSLDDYLFNRNKLKDLSWSQRLNIIKGVASALLYLHEEWEQVVLHRDIKASNILLDADLNGRLGDFGLARFHDRGENLQATRVVGTIGYMAPELTAMGVATTKTDVYAFGSFILEVVCGRRPVEPDRPPEQMLLLKWVATCGRRDTLMDIVDSKLGDFKAEEAKLLLKLGMLCSQSNPESRPSMRDVIKYLEGNATIPSISFDTAGFGAEESEIYKLRWERRSSLFLMAGVLGSVGFWMIIGIHVTFLVFAQEGDQFLYYNFKNANLKLDGMANTNDGPLHLTNNTNTSTGHAFYNIPIKFPASSLSSFSFSTEFVFAIFPLQTYAYGHGMAFVVSPTKDLGSNGTENSYLGLFNKTNDNNTTNHIFAVELDTHKSPEQSDKSDNQVGIDIYTTDSFKSAEASYFNATEGKNESLLLASGKSILIWIDYDGIEQLLNVTLAPVPTSKPVSPLFSSSIKPRVPLLSTSINLSEIFNETMYVGFSGSTGTIKSNQYILGWSFKKGGEPKSLDISRISDPPPPPSSPPLTSPPQSSPPPPSPPPSSLSRLPLKKKYAEVLEQWEKEYSPQRYSFRNLYKATKGFRENQLLGAGGFGKVYKGILPSGTQIAVKKVYHDAEQGMKQYVAEIASMGRLRHKNLVQLLGYCRRKGELLLVYDYMPNGSLDDYLFNKNKLKDLTWSQRVNIIKGVASALLYLHEEWEQVVLHRDIKASNILLDADLNGKLGDFGLARFHDRGVNLEATRVVGTIGYMAPELTAMGVTTTWTDVYAFGAFILEVVCGRRPVDPDAPREQMILVKWVASCGRRDALTDTVDSKLIGYEVGEVKLLLKLGMLCSQSNPENRPSMRQILQYLEGNVSVPAISFDTVALGIPNISHETVTQMTTTSSSANFSFEDVTVLFGGR